MRISAPRARRTERARRIEADVVFEDADREPLSVHYEIEGPLAEDLTPLPEAFVLAAYPAALHAGERRLRIEGPLDPTFRAGTEQALSLFASWHAAYGPLALESNEPARPLVPARERHTAALFTGGLDAMAMLCANRRAFPLEHPRSIRSGIYLFGGTTYDYRDGEASPPHRAAYARHAARLERFGERVGLSMNRARTNACMLYPDARTFMDTGFAAVDVAALLATGRRVTDVRFGSTGWGPRPRPHGSHPALDVLFSTSAVDVRTAQPLLTRFEKGGIVADWPPAFDTLHPCHDYLRLAEGQVNCGVCEKCLRTKTILLAWGALARFTALPGDDITPAMIDAIEIKPHIGLWEDEGLHARLRSIGRDDLSRAIEDAVRKPLEGWWGRRRRKLRRSVAKRWPSRRRR